MVSRTTSDPIRLLVCLFAIAGCSGPTRRIGALNDAGAPTSDAPGAIDDSGRDPGVDAPVPIDAAPDARPGTVDVAITPAMPRTADDLTAVITNENGPAYTIQWSRSGIVQPSLTGTAVANALTTKGDVWTTDLIGAQHQTLAHASVTIANTAPSAPIASVQPTASPGVPIMCQLAGGSTDPDNDSITYHATWTRNGVAFASTTSTAVLGDTIPGGVTVNGDSFACTMSASDGTDTAQSVAATVHVSCGGSATPISFAFTAGSQTYVVPSCVTHLTIETWGAQGGGPNGGLGGYARGMLDVSPGELLFVEVGGMTGYNGGGAGIASANPASGGGASDVRFGDDQLTSRIIVAGGGGGGPMQDVLLLGGAGGGGTCGNNYCGGGGGNGYGGTPGTTAFASPGGLDGGAAFITDHGGGGGGGGAASGGGGSCEVAVQPATCAAAGFLGGGGAGATGGNPFCYSTYGGTAGGGGGYYGGGGTAVGYCGGGAGGGGSSWTGGLASPAMTGGTKTGNGAVTITPS